jgi:hypothetical protein
MMETRTETGRDNSEGLDERVMRVRERGKGWREGGVERGWQDRLGERQGNSAEIGQRQCLLLKSNQITFYWSHTHD